MEGSDRRRETDRGQGNRQASSKRRRRKWKRGEGGCGWELREFTCKTKRIKPFVIFRFPPVANHRLATVRCTVRELLQAFAGFTRGWVGGWTFHTTRGHARLPCRNYSIKNPFFSPPLSDVRRAPYSEDTNKWRVCSERRPATEASPASSCPCCPWRHVQPGARPARH